MKQKEMDSSVKKAMVKAMKSKQMMKAHSTPRKKHKKKLIND